MAKTLFRVRKSAHLVCTPCWVLGFLSLANKSKIQKLMQQVRSAKSSKSGRVARRAVDMMLKSTAISPAYSTIVKAGRSVNRSRRNKGSRKQNVSISMCVGKFMLAGTNPFHQGAQGACIPDGNVASSVRCFVRRQITVTVGTAGLGFCHFFAPLASDGVLAVCSNATFAGGNGQFLTAGNTFAVGTSGISVNLPTAFDSGDLKTGYAANDDRAAFNARIVAAGFSFRYTGKEIDRAGQVYVYTQPLHNSSASVYNVGGTEVVAGQSELSQYLETMIVESAREDTHIPLFPVSDVELEYSGESSASIPQLLYPWSQGATRQPGGFEFQDAGSNNVGVPTTTMIIIGTPGSTYLINYGQHMEVIGPGVAAFSKMPAESDAVGVKDVMGATTRFQLTRLREPGVDATAEFKKAIASVQKDRSVRSTY